MSWLLTALFLSGHLALWITMFNRAHAVGLSCRWVRITELTLILSAVGGLLWTLNRIWMDPAWFLAVVQNSLDRRGTISQYLLAIYILGCAVFAVWVAVQWVARRGWRVPSVGLVSNHTDRIDVTRELGFRPMRGLVTRAFACLPMNQMFDLYVQTKTICMPRLPAELEGFSILHLSDLHFTGKITRPFFDYVFERSNELNADLVVITGDILENAACFEWLPALPGRLRSRYGVYFILGNHDRMIGDGERLRRELTALGLHDVGRQVATTEVHGQSILLSGNELPWFQPPPAVPDETGRRHGLRILLSHSPDQLPWARQRNFDLMLAGHTHGGHIRLPIAGPLVCPSRFGVKYASGLFYEPPTVLHVTRGISGLDPVRFNCPPEIAKLILRRSDV